MTEQEKQDEMHPKEKNVAKRSSDQLVVDYVETKAEGERRLAFISRHGLLGAYFAEGSP